MTYDLCYARAYRTYTAKMDVMGVKFRIVYHLYNGKSSGLRCTWNPFNPQDVLRFISYIPRNGIFGAIFNHDLTMTTDIYGFTIEEGAHRDDADCLYEFWITKGGRVRDHPMPYDVWCSESSVIEAFRKVRYEANCFRGLKWETISVSIDCDSNGCGVFNYTLPNGETVQSAVHSLEEFARNIAIASRGDWGLWSLIEVGPDHQSMCDLECFSEFRKQKALVHDTECLNIIVNRKDGQPRTDSRL